MARVTYGALVTELKGKIGGSVFQSNRYGFTMKNKGLMKKPNSALVFQCQAYLKAAVNAWRALTDAQRIEFNNYAAAFPQYAANNPTSVLNGYNIFVMWQATRLNCQNGLGGQPEMFDVLFPSVNPFVYASSTELLFELNESATEPDAGWGLFMTPAYSPTRSYPFSNFRFIKNFSTSEGSVSIFDRYVAKFGVNLVVGQIVFVKLVPFGILTPEVDAHLLFKLVVEEV